MSASRFPPDSPRPRALRTWVGLLFLAAVMAACGERKPRAEEVPPPASFLVVAGDSTFWVEASSTGVHVRRSPLLLARLEGDFHELYIAEDDRSFSDALIVGQRLYRRDLASGDSTLLLESAVLHAIATEHMVARPDDPPLAPDDEVSPDAPTHATTETELLDAIGPFVSFELHTDIDGTQGRDEHTTRHGVLDARDGHRVTVRDLAGEAIARATYDEGRRRLAAATDSVRATRDDRARRAVDVIESFVFDSTSFALVEDAGEPAVAFLVPGIGERAGGYSLPLAPVRIPSGPWWDAIRPSLPERVKERMRWTSPVYDVLAREDSSGDWATISLRRAKGREEWVVARVPLPVKRVERLDSLPPDSPGVRALSRAFDESSLYSGEARTASLRHPPVEHSRTTLVRRVGVPPRSVTRGARHVRTRRS